MGWREILALRKQGRSDEALEMARAEFPEHKDDIWFLRAYAWSLYDQAKTLVDRYEAKQLSGRALSGEFAPCMNEFADMADPLRGDVAFSQILRLAGKVSRDWDDFLLFARWAGTGSFSADDEKPFVTDDGKTIDCLKVRFTRAICRETAARASDGLTDAELIGWGEGVLEQALQASPNDQWFNYYRSKLHLARGERDQAIKRLMPVLQRQSRAAWPWALLADIIEPTQPEDALTCLIHATRLAHKEQEVGKVRIRLANRLARANRFDEAARQADLAAEYRAHNGYRVPQELQQLLASDWYTRVHAAGTSRDLPKVDVAAQQLLCELDPQPLAYTVAVIENINVAKSLSYAATGASTGFVLKYSRFPNVANLAVGTVIEVGHVEDDGQARDWRPSALEVIPGLYEAVSGTLERVEGKPFAFIRGPQNDVFVPPSLAQRFAPGSSSDVTCKAVWRTSEKGKTGWRAIDVSGDADSVKA